MLSTGAIVGSKAVGVSVVLPIVGAPVSLTGALVGSSAVGSVVGSLSSDETTGEGGTGEGGAGEGGFKPATPIPST